MIQLLWLLRLWCHEAHVDHIESQAGDPLHQPGQCALIWQLRPESRPVGTYADLTVVELRAQRGARLAQEGDLIRSCVHRATPPVFSFLRARVRETPASRAARSQASPYRG